MRRAKLTVFGAVGALVLGLAIPVLADHRIDGTYNLGGWNNPDQHSKVWIKHVSGNEFDVVRQVENPDGTQRNEYGKGRLGNTWLRVVFRSQGGVSGALTGNGGNEITGRAVYGVRPGGRIIGLFRSKDADGNIVRTYERGDKGADEAMPTPGGDSTGDDTGDDQTGDDTGDDDTGDDTTGLALQSPAAGTYLVGQTLPLQVQPADADVVVEGAGTKGADGIEITGPGAVTVKVSKDGQEKVVTLEAVEVELVQIEVLNTTPISDAPAPHFKRDLGAADGEVNTPAAITLGTPLRLKVTLQSTKDLSADAKVMLKGEIAGESNGFEQEVTLRGLAGGQTIEVETSEMLHKGVNVNAFDLVLNVAGKELTQQPRMRVYTTYKAPIKNVARDRREPNTLIHFENACRWSRGASQNIGEGKESLGHNFDNMMRHYVHPKDHVAGSPPVVSDYAKDAPAPLNYDKIGWPRVRNGERPVGSLYYPPLDVNDPPTEDYSHYRNNFGWWVLDNPTHTGGRCNQQASLVCGIAGTLGIKGEVLYLHRYGRGKKSGRPVRQYFYSNDRWPAQSDTGGGPWNFHGVALLTMEDGSQWIYDGSFSSPPNRKNGTREWAENDGGPFIHSWGPWLYDDGFGGRVAADDIPDTWRGIQPKQ